MKTAAHGTAFSPGGKGDMWPAWLFRAQTPGPLRDTLRVLGFCTEPGAQRRPGLAQGHPTASWQPGWARARSPGSALAPDPDLPAGGGGVSQLGPSRGTEGPFFADQQSPCSPRARLQPPSSPADEEILVPASTNMCAFWREWQPGPLAEWEPLKAQREATGGLGTEQAAGCFL